MLMPETVAGLAPLPALSTQLPVTDWPAPSVLRVVGASELATPERASLQVKLTVTAVLFQPAALAAGDRLPLIDGAVRSMSMAETVAPAELPALSRQVPERDWAAPSAVRVVGAAGLATPERASPQVKRTVTAELFQPAALATGLRLPVMTGGVRSMLIPVTVAPAELPAWSTQVPKRDWAAPSAL